MRIMIILNPTNKRGTMTEYRKLREFLVKDGYLRIGSDSFMRIVNNRKAADKHIKRMQGFYPKSGQVFVFRLTEKQFSSSQTTIGQYDYQEHLIGINKIVML